MAEATSVFIATPAYGGQVTSPYLASITELVRAFERAQPKIESDIVLFSHALVSQSRNQFASKFLEAGQFTHMLMIDSDMGFKPDLIMRMLRLQRSITAVCYPKRTIDLEKVVAVSRSAPSQLSTAEILAKAYEFVCEGDFITEKLPDGSHRFDIQDGFVRARSAGAGIMLIERSAMTTLYTTYPELRSTNIPSGPMDLKSTFFQPFNEIVLDDGTTLSEDISFCRRWVDGCGGDIWVNIDAPVAHQGPMIHQARFWDRLTASRIS